MIMQLRRKVLDIFHFISYSFFFSFFFYLVILVGAGLDNRISIFLILFVYQLETTLNKD